MSDLTVDALKYAVLELRLADIEARLTQIEEALQIPGPSKLGPPMIIPQQQEGEE